MNNAVKRRNTKSTRIVTLTPHEGDPIMSNIHKLDKEIAELKADVASLRRKRNLEIRILYVKHGATKAARKLNMSRQGVYNIVNGVVSDSSL